MSMHELSTCDQLVGKGCGRQECGSSDRGELDYANVFV
jgi:hypothetical protein